MIVGAGGRVSAAKWTIDPVVDAPASASALPSEMKSETADSSPSDLAPKPFDLIPRTEKEPTAEQDATMTTESSCVSGDCGSCGSCGPCGAPVCNVGPEGRAWFRADYLLWWTRSPYVGPLVTTSTDPLDGGILGRPTTSILFGDRRTNTDARSNFRFTAGWWFDCGRTGGIEFDAFTLGEANDGYSFTSSGSPLLARPFYDVSLAQQNAELVAHPTWLGGTTSGNISEYFQSAGFHLRLNLCCCEAYCPTPRCDEVCTRAELYYQYARAFAAAHTQPDSYRVDLIAGYRHYRLNDRLEIHEDLLVLENHPPDVAGTQFDINDRFRSQNDFHGGELGLVAQFYRGPWSFEFLAKMGIGNHNQVVQISGNTLVSRPGADPYNHQGGLLALPTNIGHYTRDQFVVIPEFGIELGYQIDCRWRAYVGYNVLYWANVLRASEQVDFSVNPTQFSGGELVGEARPAFSFHDSDFWAQGLNFGLECRF